MQMTAVAINGHVRLGSVAWTEAPPAFWDAKMFSLPRSCWSGRAGVSIALGWHLLALALTGALPVPVWPQGTHPLATAKDLMSEPWHHQPLPQRCPSKAGLQLPQPCPALPSHGPHWAMGSMFQPGLSLSPSAGRCPMPGAAPFFLAALFLAAVGTDSFCQALCWGRVPVVVTRCPHPWVNLWDTLKQGGYHQQPVFRQQDRVPGLPGVREQMYSHGAQHQLPLSRACSGCGSCGGVCRLSPPPSEVTSDSWGKATS